MAPAPRILITRPEPGASRTAAALCEAGFEPVVLPFTQTVSLPVASRQVEAAAACQAAAVTSAKALTHAPPELMSALRRKPVFAVGDATAKAAVAHGLDVSAAGGDAGSLAELIESALPPERGVAYLCGRVRTGTLERRLSESGRRFTLIETYDIAKVSQLTDKIEALTRLPPPDALLFHSGVSAQLFIAAAERRDLWKFFEKTAFLVISDRVARLFETHLPARVLAADAPRDADMIALARHHVPPR